MKTTLTQKRAEPVCAHATGQRGTSADTSRAGVHRPRVKEDTATAPKKPPLETTNLLKEEEQREPSVREPVKKRRPRRRAVLCRTRTCARWAGFPKKEKGIERSDSHWMKINESQYRYRIGRITIDKDESPFNG